MSNTEIELGRALVKENVYLIVKFDPMNGHYVLSLESPRQFTEILVVDSFLGASKLLRVWMDLTGNNQVPWYKGLDWREEMRIQKEKRIDGEYKKRLEERYKKDTAQTQEKQETKDERTNPHRGGRRSGRRRNSMVQRQVRPGKEDK